MLSYIIGLIIVILTITGLNFYALKAYGLEGYHSRYFFPFTFIGALVTLLSIFKIGYDTFMLFVNTSLEVAIERDKNRERVLGEEEVSKMWKKVQSNMGKFQSYFGRESFILIDNNNVAAPVPRGAAWEKGVFDQLYVEIGKLIRAEPTSRAANAWIESQRRGG